MKRLRRGEIAVSRSSSNTQHYNRGQENHLSQCTSCKPSTRQGSRNSNTPISCLQRVVAGYSLPCSRGSRLYARKLTNLQKRATTYLDTYSSICDPSTSTTGGRERKEDFHFWPDPRNGSEGNESDGDSRATTSELQDLWRHFPFFDKT